MYDSLKMATILIDPKAEIYRGQQIAHGNFGKVYYGFDKLNNRSLALKLVSVDKNESWKQQIATLKLFDHPNIVKCYGHIPLINSEKEVGKNVYIMTEYVGGMTLSFFIQRNFLILKRGLTEELVYKFFMQLIDGFEHIHNKNYVHRDIKTENILVDSAENIKIIDFGQSKQRNLLQTKDIGTPLYSAPETFQGNVPGDYRRDVWSLGLVLYQMINGKHLFQEWIDSTDNQGFKKFVKQNPLSIKISKNFSPIWNDIVRKMLEKDCNKRINLHQIKFKLKNRENQFEMKFAPMKTSNPASKPLTQSNICGNVDYINQYADMFEINRTKRFLNFFNNKHKFLILLKDHLSRFNYPFLSNSHKLILVFLSLCIYVSAIEHLLKRLELNKIRISDSQCYDATKYEQPYQSHMKHYLEIYRQYFDMQLRLTKEFLFERVIPKFSPYQTRSEGGESSSQKCTSTSSKKSKTIQPFELINSYPEIKASLQKFREGVIHPKAKYLQIFRELIFSKDFFHCKQNLQKYFYEQDLIVYYLMLIISYLDDTLKWQSNQYEGNVLPKLRQQLLNAFRQQDEIEQLIKEILTYQKRFEVK